MTRLALCLACALLLAAPASAAAPSRVLVKADEWSLVLSRQTLPPGSAIVQLLNRGEDGHDLRVQRVGGVRSVGLPETRPGKTADLRLKLRRGRYRLWCSLPGHRAAGMRATLRVR